MMLPDTIEAKTRVFGVPGEQGTIKCDRYETKRNFRW